ncbi:hypothetical protein ACMU_11560 [Actibacterium mucosum KCTC 23349]|uniref:Dihydroorotate dehydrogenase n=1 Tax=Actibacterium mucosum KCTC 23349 TaxID=1454373 RepID=A0A037ZFS4_9RHOB|nr:hypothetical protein [Actibacterium mucosum]KAJ55325.1 hypothetical protein ACMU_11560 [Actibacterium mucosum KCTC 23349]
MTERDEQIKDEAALDALFDAVRADQPVPPAALFERVAQDALREMPQMAPMASPKRRGLGWVLAALGGWPTVTGLATATVAGVWLGYTEPGSLNAVTGAIWPSADSAYGLGDLVPSYDYLLAGDDA